MKPIAIYAGSFDPPTYGHMDIIERAARLFPKLIVLLASHPTRKALLSVDERVQLLGELCATYPNVQVDRFQGLIIDYAKSQAATVLVRGVRGAADVNYELQMAQANADLSSIGSPSARLETVFLPADPARAFISASLVREVSSHAGDISRYAPPVVCAALSRIRSEPRG